MMHEDIVEHVSYDKGRTEGYAQGKRFTQDKVLELMNEVINEYEKLAENDVDPEIRAQISATRFMKSWVTSGGQEDFDGKRVCLPW